MNWTEHNHRGSRFSTIIIGMFPITATTTNGWCVWANDLSGEGHKIMEVNYEEGQTLESNKRDALQWLKAAIVTTKTLIENVQ